MVDCLLGGRLDWKGNELIAEPMSVVTVGDELIVDGLDPDSAASVGMCTFRGEDVREFALVLA